MKRYRAFISYSQRDKAVGRRLQRWLETYRVPAGSGADIDRSRRLGRFFRDDDEMPASSDLAATLRGAIEDSENLIVICSPNAAKSRWVNEEILHFRRLGGSNAIFAVIAEGTPNASDPARECFPPELRSPAEPLALDLRKESKSRIRTRLAAGLLRLPFDDLWRRERRRRRRTAILLAALAFVAIGVVGLLVARTIDAQRIAREQERIARAQERITRAQERTARLVTVSETLGSNGAAALSIMRDLLRSDPADAAVGDVAHAIASWAKTPPEIETAFPTPRLFSSGNRLVLRTRGSRVDVGDVAPLRRIGFSRGRFVVVYADRIVSVDQASGKILSAIDGSARGDLSNIDWNGLAFEAADGTGLVAGTHIGVSNSQVWHSLLVVRIGGALSILTPLQHPAHDDPWRSRYIEDVIISPSCDAIGILDHSQEGVDPAARTKFIVSIADGLRFNGTTETMAGGLLTLYPPGDDHGFWEVVVDTSVEERGCRNPVFDTAHNYTLAGLGGLVLATDVTASPTPPREWQEAGVRRSGYEGDERWDRRLKKPEGFNPCTGGCRLLHGRRRPDEEFDGESGWGTHWVESTLPGSGTIAGPLAGEFAANPLYTFHEQNNASVESVWCRRIGDAKPACVRTLNWIEYRHDWSDIDRRSSSGRFVFYSNGVNPFEVFDVQAMRAATPEGNTIVSTPGVAAFGDSLDDRLFVFAGHRLSVFEPRAANGLFADVSTALPWQRRLAGIDHTNPIVALAAHPSGDLIAASQNGLLVRFDWRTGRSAWSRQLQGLGMIRALRRSPAADSVAVVGERGIRVVRVRDGLLSSGVLVPPYLFDPSFDATLCIDRHAPTTELTGMMTDVDLDDRGRVTVSCGGARFSWSPRAYRGDVGNRIATLLTAK